MSDIYRLLKREHHTGESREAYSLKGDMEK